MEKSRFGRFLDTTALAIIFYILVLSILGKYFIVVHSLVLSLALTFVFIKIVLHFQNKKYEKLNIKKQELKLIKLTNIEVRKLTKKEQFYFFVKALGQDVITTWNSFILVNNVVIKPTLYINKITEENIFETYAQVKLIKNKYEEVAILCNDYTPEAKSLAKTLDKKIVLLTPPAIYSVLKKYNYLPPLPEETKKVRLTPRVLFQSSFVKKQAKSFIISGLLLYFTSLFIPYTTYYLITASILLLFGLTCLIFGKRENKLSLESILLK